MGSGRSAQSTSPSPGQAGGPPGRPRCEAIESKRAPDGARRVEVELSWPDGARSSGDSHGVGLREAEMRAAAEATLTALHGGPLGRLPLRLKGAKSVRAFDQEVVIIAVEWDRKGDRQSLIGAVAAPSRDRIRGAVLSTLDAVNRVVEGGRELLDSRGAPAGEPAEAGSAGSGSDPRVSDPDRSDTATPSAGTA